MRLFIIGIGGFIGSSLTERISKQHSSWEIFGIDPCLDKVLHLSKSKNIHLRQGLTENEKNWVSEQIALADVVLPLAAIANPEQYVRKPLQVFELDFEANLDIIRQCVKLKKHIIFPSTSEVYGMCEDSFYDEERSCLVTGPIHKERWIYSSSKQLLDRIIYAYGKHQGLSYTIFRPFNWIGPYLDHLTLEKGGQGRSLVRFLGNILRGEEILISGDGTQRRSFTDIEDALDALILMIKNKETAKGHVFNLGNPKNDISITGYVQMIKKLVFDHKDAPSVAKKSKIKFVPQEVLFGSSYQDIQKRIPSIEKASQLLNWRPQRTLQETLECTVSFHIERLFKKKKKTAKKKPTHAA